MLYFYSSVDRINRCKPVELQKKKNGNKHEQRKHNIAKVNCSGILHAPQFKVYMISRHAKQANSLFHQRPNELFGIYFLLLFLRSRFTFVLLFDNRFFTSFLLFVLYTAASTNSIEFVRIPIGSCFSWLQLLVWQRFLFPFPPNSCYSADVVYVYFVYIILVQNSVHLCPFMRYVQMHFHIEKKLHNYFKYSAIYCEQ